MQLLHSATKASPPALFVVRSGVIHRGTDGFPHGISWDLPSLVEVSFGRPIRGSVCTPAVSRTLIGRPVVLPSSDYSVDWDLYEGIQGQVIQFIARVPYGVKPGNAIREALQKPGSGTWLDTPALIARNARKRPDPIKVTPPDNNSDCSTMTPSQMGTATP